MIAQVVREFELPHNYDKLDEIRLLVPQSLYTSEWETVVHLNLSSPPRVSILVNRDGPPRERCFQVIQPNQEVPATYRYWVSATDSWGRAWHLFEKGSV